MENVNDLLYSEMVRKINGWDSTRLDWPCQEYLAYVHEPALINDRTVGQVLDIMHPCHLIFAMVHLQIIGRPQMVLLDPLTLSDSIDPESTYSQLEEEGETEDWHNYDNYLEWVWEQINNLTDDNPAGYILERL